MAKAKSTAKKVIKKKRSAAQSSSRPNQQAALVPREPFQGWPPDLNRPPTDGLTVFFHGLLSFCYDGPHDECQVGAYNQSNHHQFRIEIVGGSCSNDRIFLRDDLLEVGHHTLQQAGASGPLFYMPAPFDRLAGTPPDAKDFRWMLDIEGSDIYGEVTGKQSVFYSPKILINTGTFYTLERTVSKFARVDQVNGDEIELGSIAFCMAAYINVATTPAVLTLITDDGGSETCTFGPGGGPYSIFINNDCPVTDPSCRRSDFSHHLASVSPPAGKHSVTVELDKPAPMPVSHSCGRKLIVSNDETPCTSAGYGGTRGLP